MSSAENLLRQVLKRKDSQTELFERKFIAYRDKMLQIYDCLEESDPLKANIKEFLQDAQGDVTFGGETLG